jgi:lysophospholipase L1-like esterase
MKTILLIGDSIRMGYEATVRAELAGVADVWSPQENGGTSRNVLAHLQEWVLDRTPALVHLNCGLHDLKREFGQTENAVPLAEYRANLGRLFDAVRQRTAARLIWAATTPVNEEWHHRNKPFDRLERDVDAYNRVAREEAEARGIPVDDLFAVVRDAGRDRLLLSDGVHFNPEGCTLLGKAVAACLRAHLEPAP